jgi:hypothetical protein
MKRSSILSMALIFLTITLVTASAAAARGRRFGGYGGGISVSTGNVTVSSGGFAGFGRHYASPGVSVRVGAGHYGRRHAYGPQRYGRHYGRHALPLYGRGYGYPAGGLSISLYGAGGGVGYVSLHGGGGYGTDFFSRSHGYRPYYRSGHPVTVSVPAGSSLPYMTRTWVPGRMTEWGYSRGHWAIRPMSPAR